MASVQTGSNPSYWSCKNHPFSSLLEGHENDLRSIASRFEWNPRLVAAFIALMILIGIILWAGTTLVQAASRVINGYKASETSLLAESPRGKSKQAVAQAVPLPVLLKDSAAVPT